jgi:hypothetical protein
MADEAGRPAEGELGQRLRYELLRTPPEGVPSNVVVRLDFERASSWDLQTLSIGETLRVASSIARLLSGVRSADARDLELPEASGEPEIDVAEMEARVHRVASIFDQAHSRLESLAADPAGADAEQLRTALVAIAYFDGRAIPVSATGDSEADRAALTEQAVSIVKETKRRLRRIQSIWSGNRSEMSPEQRLQADRERIAILLGKAFQIVPRFRPSNTASVDQVLEAANTLLTGDALAPLTWMQRMARVRDGAARLNDVFDYVQCVTPSTEPDLRVVQFPHRPGDRWTALPFGPDKKEPEAVLSLALQVPTGFGQKLPADLAALLVDEWVDVTPRQTESTGIAFNYDAPGSRAPQAVLLAVAPGDQSVWDLETLETILLETFDLARLRMVEPSRLDDEVSHFLPALYFGLNLAGETVSTDFHDGAAQATERTMPSITSWTRLEPQSRRRGIDTGLQARVHDPLWMLARQWQVGEFRAEDSGSPVIARLRAEVAKLTRYSAGFLADGTPSIRSYDGSIPLEAAVEREPVLRGGASGSNLQLVVEAGQFFLRLLALHGVAKYRESFIRAYPLTAPDGHDAVDTETLRFLAVVARRAVDGGRLRDALRAARRPPAGPPTLPAEPSIESADREAVGRAADAFLTWYDNLVQEPPDAAPSPWIPERMEYAFSVAAPTGEGERVLVADEYVEGRLDWYTFDERPGASLGADPVQSPPASVVRTIIPAPVSYDGMPANRWWEFEDATVDFGSVEAGPSDLVRLLLIEFSVEYAADWFILPIELEVGSICTAHSLVVVDTFGEQTLIRHYSEVDGPSGKWHMFHGSLDRQAAPVSRPARSRFFLPPALAASLNGPAVEEVLLLRDGLANLAFGVERIVEGRAGHAVNRFENYQAKKSRQQDAEPSTASPDSDAPLKYRLATRIPDHWIPLIPVQAADKRSVRLKRGRLLASSNGGTTLPVPAGRILEPGRALSLFEEEVPRSGARITRAWQYARWTDGSTHLWVGRRKQPGRGEGSSGLRFDVVDPPS